MLLLGYHVLSAANDRRGWIQGNQIAMAKKKYSRFSQRTVVVIATSITVMFFAFLIFAFGSVRGVEFSPTHFQTRTFSVYEIPLLKLQISPIRRETPLQSKTVNFLYAQNYLNRPTGIAPAEWHLSQLSRSGMGAYEADAYLLTQQLEFQNWRSSTQDTHWEEWSKNNPAIAKVLWPTIQQLAIRELYILMPQIFDDALSATNEVVFKKQVDDYLRTHYAELVTELRSAKRDHIADELLKEALFDYPTDPALLKLK